MVTHPCDLDDDDDQFKNPCDVPYSSPIECPVCDGEADMLCASCSGFGDCNCDCPKCDKECKYLPKEVI